MVSFELNDQKSLFSLIGLKSIMQFLVKPQNLKGMISFGAGFPFVVIGWSILGMILEGSGFFMLFSGFWPTMALFLPRIPILGWFLKQSNVRSFFDRYRIMIRADECLYNLETKKYCTASKCRQAQFHF